jgi:hypothetical protein
MVQSLAHAVSVFGNTPTNDCWKKWLINRVKASIDKENSPLYDPKMSTNKARKKNSLALISDSHLMPF